MGNLTGVTLRSSDVKQSLLQEYKPDNWDQFEDAVLAYLRQELAGIGIETLTMDIANSAHPGPLSLKFNVDAQNTITADMLKQVLRR
jgi:hypothetical protein